MPEYLAFFLWKKVAPDDSRLFVEKPRPCRGLAWLIFGSFSIIKSAGSSSQSKTPSSNKRAGVFLFRFLSLIQDNTKSPKELGPTDRRQMRQSSTAPS